MGRSNKMSNRESTREYFRRLWEYRHHDEDKPEEIHPDDREREHVPDDEREPWQVKLKKPIKLPEGVQRIIDAFNSKEIKGDIEAELHKDRPNPHLYSLGKVFGTKLQSLDKDERKELKVANAKVYVTGGAVRDHLMSLYKPEKLHKGPRNWNLVTDARPQVIQLILLNADPAIPCKRTGPATVVAEVDGKTYEIETFHEVPDGAKENDSENYTIFSTPFRDSKRRDFRINALRYDPVKQVILDDLGGFGDITPEGKLFFRPTKGTPKELFKKNPKAALRCLRLHAKLVGGGLDTLDPDVAEALMSCRLPEDMKPGEVLDEFMTGLKSADDQNHFVKNWAKAGGLGGAKFVQKVFPGLDVSEDMDLPNNTHPHVALAMALKGNQSDKVDSVRTAMKKAGFPAEAVNDVVFLLGLGKFNDPSSVEDFNKSYDYGISRLVPSAVANFANWSKLPNAKLIQSFLKHKTAGRDNPRTDDLPDGEKKAGASERLQKDFKQFSGMK